MKLNTGFMTMRRPRRTAAIAGASLAILSAGQLALSSPASALATTRYASPNGSGSTCLKATPCQLAAAMEDSGSGDTVVLEPGTYPGPGASFDTELTDHTSITLTGETGETRPVISSTANFAAVDFAFGSTLRDVRINYTGGGAALELDDSAADHVAVYSDSTAVSDGYAACEVTGGTSDPGVLTDSLCVQTGASNAAVTVETNGADDLTELRNVTAVSRGPNGVGLDLYELGTAAMNVEATNSIFQGASGGHDVLVKNVISTGSAVAKLSHDDYKTTMTSGGGKITAGAGNIHKPAVFVNGKAHNYQERPSSPTIDKGSETGVGAGEVDLLGSPRTLGPTVDIGAYEHLEKAKVGTPAPSKRTAHTIHLAAGVDPEGLPTTVTFIAIVSGHVVAHQTLSAGHGITVRVFSVTLHGVPSTKPYKVQAVATNAAGKAKSSKRTIPIK
jgi:hypothetical protein